MPHPQIVLAGGPLVITIPSHPSGPEVACHNGTCTIRFVGAHPPLVLSSPYGSHGCYPIQEPGGYGGCQFRVSQNRPILYLDNFAKPGLKKSASTTSALGERLGGPALAMALMGIYPFILDVD